MLGYVVYLIVQMVTFKLDKYSSQTMALDHEQEENVIKMADFNFLPSFNIDLLDNTKKTRTRIDADAKFDLFDQKIENVAYPVINLKKLEQYVKIRFLTQNRFKDGEDQ